MIGGSLHLMRPAAVFHGVPSRPVPSRPALLRAHDLPPEMRRPDPIKRHRQWLVRNQR
jgi:hypothetical protein